MTSSLIIKAGKVEKRLGRRDAFSCPFPLFHYSFAHSLLQLGPLKLYIRQLRRLDDLLDCFLFRSKSSDLNDYKEKMQNQAEAFKQETKKKDKDLVAKEKQIQQLLDNCKNLETCIGEFTKTRSEEQEKSANSLEEIKALKESFTKAKDEAASLKQEREMMITAHHNRIEQLRESFKKKMEEADAWPGKVHTLN